MDKKKIQKLLKNKKLIIVIILVLVGLVCLILLKNLLSPNGNISKYGNRLEGIDKVKFSTSDKKNIISKLNENDKVSSAEINVHGKIINVLFNVSKETTVDDAHAIASESINNFSDKIKNFYDIEYIITNTDEEGTTQTVTNDDGTTTEEEVKTFPIMGYKNSSSDELIW